MAKPARVCLTGAGGHARRNLYPNLFRITGAEILANCDLDESLAQEVARRHAIARSDADYGKMIEAERPDGAMD